MNNNAAALLAKNGMHPVPLVPPERWQRLLSRGLLSQGESDPINREDFLRQCLHTMLEFRYSSRGRLLSGGASASPAAARFRSSRSAFSFGSVAAEEAANEATALSDRKIAFSGVRSRSVFSFVSDTTVVVVAMGFSGCKMPVSGDRCVPSVFSLRFATAGAAVFDATALPSRNLALFGELFSREGGAVEAGGGVSVGGTCGRAQK